MTGQEAFKDVLYILSAVSNYEIDTNCETIKTIEKSLKALEIIKEKRVDLPYLRCCIEDNQSFERYNEYINSKTMDYDHEEELTEEEFNLLKEVLSSSILEPTQESIK